ncbi:type VI secretion system baseplate subunit TssE [Shewanella surugensis]|uniref:Type VI secretion system baseplate subunit TssE n=1 Tax=Shewanella surugensis TaxID=212020 RepID=A0ABT0LCY7_9GAMM|nr:type VI secretion system baseplate subunit TssE [Shewanella surugensis]MCL1125548.1 type VI secretion system baseplate subunit TssE [Shewanella surugensis]
MFDTEENKLRGSSFFERLIPDAPRVSAYHSSVDETMDSIKRSIARVLNARIGESQSCPEYGLLDFNDASLGSFDLGLQIRLSIKNCIERFEPRISNVEVTVFHDESSPLNLTFNIVGKLAVSHMDEKIQIELFLDNNRKYRVI